MTDPEILTRALVAITSDPPGDRCLRGGGPVGSCFRRNSGQRGMECHRCVGRQALNDYDASRGRPIALMADLGLMLASIRDGDEVRVRCVDPTRSDGALMTLQGTATVSPFTGQATVATVPILHAALPVGGPPKAADYVLSVESVRRPVPTEPLDVALHYDVEGDRWVRTREGKWLLLDAKPDTGPACTYAWAVLVREHGPLTTAPPTVAVGHE